MHFDFEKLHDGGYFMQANNYSHGCKMPPDWVPTKSSIEEVKRRMLIIARLAAKEELTTDDDGLSTLSITQRVYVEGIGLITVKVSHGGKFRDYLSRGASLGIRYPVMALRDYEDSFINELRIRAASELIHKGMRWAAGFTDTEYEGVVVYD